jgi:hypothetical protein
VSESTDDVDLVTCPVDGCDYRSVRQSVVAHYSGKQDDAHAGGYHMARQTVPGGEPDPEPEAKPEAKPDSGDNPLFADVDPADQPDPDRDDDDELELPCGHESVPDDAIDSPRIVTCETCGGSWRVEP